jgi:DNA-binding transcriptional ArsR family regulator
MLALPYDDMAICSSVRHEKLPLSDKAMELMARRFRLLGEPFRLRILELLEGGELAVNQIVDNLQASQSNVSKHLGLLYEGGLVGRRREGSNVAYFIADPVIIQLCELVCQRAADDARITLELIGQGATDGRRPKKTRLKAKPRNAEAALARRPEGPSRAVAGRDQ